MDGRRQPVYKGYAMYAPATMADVQKIREKLGVHLDFPKKVRNLSEIHSAGH